MFKQKIKCDLISFHTAKPLDKKLLESLFRLGKLIVIVEEHGLIGGVGSSILEWANINNLNTQNVLRFGGPDKFLTGCGNQTEGRKLIGLTSQNISSKILKKIKNK